MPTTFRQLQSKYSKLLEDIYPSEEANEIILRIIEFRTGFSRSKYLLCKDEIASETISGSIAHDAELLMQSIPLQYVIGETEFYGCRFKVTPAVLIPRPETEELVDTIVNEWRGKSPSIIDFGTGSGCIAISLKKALPAASVATVDISEEAIDVAKRNAEINSTTIDFINADMRNFGAKEKFDIVVSNPPYVLESEKKDMRDNVLKHEPHLALFVSDSDPIEYYKAIARFAKQSLASNGTIYLEINQRLGKETLEMLSEHGFDGKVAKDFFGADRFIIAKWR